MIDQDLSLTDTNICWHEVAHLQVNEITRHQLLCRNQTHAASRKTLARTASRFCNSSGALRARVSWKRLSKELNTSSTAMTIVLELAQGKFENNRRLQHPRHRGPEFAGKRED